MHVNQQRNTLGSHAQQLQAAMQQLQQQSSQHMMLPQQHHHQQQHQMMALQAQQQAALLNGSGNGSGGVGGGMDCLRDAEGELCSATAACSLTQSQAYCFFSNYNVSWPRLQRRLLPDMNRLRLMAGGVSSSETH